jgi:hypothetical protein
MNTQKTRIGLVAALLIFGTAGLQAQPVFTNSFSGSAALWDVSGQYTSNIRTDLADFTADYTLTMDSNGKFTGSGMISTPSLDGYPLSVNADLSVAGAVKTVAGSPHGSIALKMNENTSEFTFKATAKGNLELNTETGQLTGSMKGSGSVTVPAMHLHKSKSFSDPNYQASLPNGKNGTWDLSLTVSPAGNNNKYTGSGTMTLSNGRIIELTTVTGTYGTTGSSKGVSKLTLKGTGVNLTLTGVLQNGQIKVQKLSGKALGQTLTQ